MAMDALEDLRGAKADQPSRPDLLWVLEAARRLVAIHEQAVALQGALATPPLGFADGIERDCLALPARAGGARVARGGAGRRGRRGRRRDARAAESRRRRLMGCLHPCAGGRSGRRDWRRMRAFGGRYTENG
jgi:hypothetical protein